MKRKSRLLDQKFVERVLRGLQCDGRYADGENLYLRVRGGYASWIFIKTMRRRQKEHAIGSVKGLADLSGRVEIGPRAGTSLAEARRIAAEYKANIARGDPAKSLLSKDYPTLDDLLNYYCEIKRVERKSTNSFVAPFLPIYRELGPTFSMNMGVAYRQSLISSGKSPSTVDNYMRLLKGVFTIYNVDRSIKINNPLDGVAFKVPSSAINSRDPLSIEVIRSVYGVLEGDYKRLWLVLAVTGARLNEIYGMKSTDIRDGFLSIEPNERRSVKNQSSKRRIPLFVELPKRTREYYWDDLASVSAVSQYFQVRIRKFIAKEDDGKRRLTTHSLRHSLTDYLRFKGVQQNIEDMYLGHSPKDISNRVYGSFEGRRNALREILKPVMGEYVGLVLGLNTSMVFPDRI